nr:hypothetical protein CFP56_25321 [Quercus suber]
MVFDDFDKWVLMILFSGFGILMGGLMMEVGLIMMVDLIDAGTTTLAYHRATDQPSSQPLSQPRLRCRPLHCPGVLSAHKKLIAEKLAEEEAERKEKFAK